MNKKPAPIGEYAVGTKTFTVYNTRKEELYPESDSMRHVPARLYYPVLKGSVDGCKRARSMTRCEAAGIKKAFMIPLNYDKMEAAGELESEAFIDAPFIEGMKFPLIVFNHGYFSYVEGNSFLLIDLASHGYAVLSVGHPYEGAGTDFDDGTSQLLDKSLSNRLYKPFLPGMIGALKLSKLKGSFEEQAAAFDEYQNKYCGYLKERIDEWMKDTDIAVDYAKKTFPELIDLSNGIGISGHSHGGATAYHYCLRREEYTCGINIDGGLFGDTKGVMHKPFMQLSCKDNERVVARVYIRHSAPAYKVLFRDMKHIAFSDMKYALGSSAIAGKLDADLAHKYTCKSFLEFFDCWLKKTKAAPDLNSDDVITVSVFEPDK